MCKPNSGNFRGTSGTKKASSGSPSALFDNGHVTFEGIAAHREEFMGKTVDQIADLLKANGYELNIRESKRKEKGSTVQIIEIINPSKERNIKQVQVSPDGSRRHGKVPYVKISTSDEGKIKIIDSKREDYETSGNEKAKLIFRRDDND